MPDERVPEIPKDLLEWLNRTTDAPTLADTTRNIFAKLGQRELIDRLQILYNRQNGHNKE